LCLVVCTCLLIKNISDGKVSCDICNVDVNPLCNLKQFLSVKTVLPYNNSINIFQYISNKMQRYTVYFIWKLPYKFRVVTPPIIRSIYNCIRSWWWVEVPFETCRAVSRINKLCNVASCWIYIGIFLRCTDPWTLNL